MGLHVHPRLAMEPREVLVEVVLVVGGAIAGVQAFAGDPQPEHLGVGDSPVLLRLPLVEINHVHVEIIIFHGTRKCDGFNFSGRENQQMNSLLPALPGGDL